MVEEVVWLKMAKVPPHKRSIPLHARFLRYEYITPLLLFILLSCAQPHDIRKAVASRIIENVPFYSQEARQCGPASLAGVLNYWGVDVSPEHIAAEIYSDSARGTLDWDMVFYAKRMGLKVRQYKGSVEDITRNIDLGHPVIIMIDYGIWIYQQNHFIVVVGYNEDGILANSGKEQLRFISFKYLSRIWKRTNFWTMLITPER
jgi:ABC-type bacteriocin/lantibiotic exporter with double-glycine peptidase domain